MVEAGGDGEADIVGDASGVKGGDGGDAWGVVVFDGGGGGGGGEVGGEDGREVWGVCSGAPG